MLDTRPSRNEKESLPIAGAKAVEALEISAVAPSAEESMGSEPKIVRLGILRREILYIHQACQTCKVVRPRKCSAPLRCDILLTFTWNFSGCRISGFGHSLLEVYS